jgi:signal transduction histidine kinase
MNQLILAELPSNVTLTLNLGESLWATSIDPDSFQEAMLNLIVNAREAMPDGGQLTLETANVILDTAYCKQNAGVDSGDYVEVSVTDAGCGIEADNIPFVFEPFFSTKDESRRTGMGLALVYGFCQRSNGHVRLQSSPDIGTTVRLYLPRISELQPAANNLESRDSDLEITPTDH